VTSENRVEPRGFERPVEIGSELALITLIVLCAADMFSAYYAM
jgi:hypothetical protein